MGGKPSNQIPSNRPESGGADRDNAKETSGLLERSKHADVRQALEAPAAQHEAELRSGRHGWILSPKPSHRKKLARDHHRRPAPSTPRFVGKL